MLKLKSLANRLPAGLQRFLRGIVDLARIPLRHLPRTAYSQEGEDLLLLRLFESQERGFYVDVGAFHPRYLSNTYAFYRRGWRGLNVDATPEVRKRFLRARPRDISVTAAVGAESGRAVLRQFRLGQLNTISDKQVDLVSGFADVRSQVEVPVLPLRTLLQQHLPGQQPIDLLNVDVEGMDYEVLASNDWSRFRPTVVCVEILVHSVRELETTATHRFMNSQGYELFSKTVNTCIYICAADLDRLLPLRKAACTP